MSTDRQWLELAVAHHQAGRLREAHELYGQVLQADPENTHALRYLGLMAQQLGNHEQAIELIEKAHRHGRPDPQSLNTLGMAHAGAGRFREAKRCFAKALGLKADYADAHGNLASTLRALGQLKEAEPSYRRALALDPRSAEAHYNLGNLLIELRRPAEALAQFEQALALRPDYVEAHNNMGSALLQLGRTDEAERCFRSAISLQPAYAQAHHNLGTLLQDLRRLDEAEQSYRAALATAPQVFETATSLGNVLHNLGRFEEALACHGDAIALRPDAAQAHYNRGNSLASLDRWEQAGASYARAIQLDPAFGAARWALAMAQLPSVYDNASQVAERRAAFARQLDELSAWVGSTPSAAEDALIQQPFHLAYQHEDNRELLAKYGKLCTTVMGRWGQRQKLTSAPARKTGPMRLGIVSAHIHGHSVWHAILKGWVRHLDRERVELHLFHLGLSDEETEFAKAKAAYFLQGSHGLRQWVDAIRQQELDALAFPEIGMHTLAAQIASLRLAPVQIASWGHPETTGIPTLDYYVSAEDFEPPDAGRYYTEKLVPLPHLGSFYEPYGTAPEAPDLAALGIPEKEPLFLCPGTPFKYLPSYDGLITAIARQLGACRFVFFIDERIPYSSKLRRRLELAFEQAGLAPQRYLVFIPWQSRARFYGLLSRAHAYLDTVGFSGFNSAMQAVECGLPIVALEGRFMRGRFGSAILRRMALDELVATSDAEYVSLAVRLGRDEEYREQMRRQIQARRQPLYGDTAPIAALQDFLTSTYSR